MTALTAEAHVILGESDLPRLSFDEVQVGLAHVAELECEKTLSVAGQLLAFRGVFRDRFVLQVIIAADRVLRLAVFILGGKLLVLTGLVVGLVGLHLT